MSDVRGGPASSDAAVRCLKAGLTVVAAALAMGVLRLPQPFLAVLAACLLTGLPGGGVGVWGRRVGWAWAGATAGAGLLVAFPQQPWLSFPAFTVLLGVFCRRAAGRIEPGGILLFCMGMAASFPAGVVNVASGFVAAMVHGLALTVGAGSVALISRGCDGAAGPPREDGDSTAWLAVPLAAVASIVLSQLIQPVGSVVMTVAAVVTAGGLSANPAPAALLRRLAGALPGVVSGVAVLAATSGSTNNVVVYLALLGFVAGLSEVPALKARGWTDAARQAAATFVVVATVFPRPVVTLDAALDRGAAVFWGVVLAGAGVGVATVVVRGARERMVGRVIGVDRP